MWLVKCALDNVREAPGACVENLLDLGAAWAGGPHSWCPPSFSLHELSAHTKGVKDLCSMGCPGGPVERLNKEYGTYEELELPIYIYLFKKNFFDRQIGQ